MEIYLITFLVLNALSRPRSITQGLYGALANDGIAFFVVRPLFCSQYVPCPLTAWSLKPDDRSLFVSRGTEVQVSD